MTNDNGNDRRPAAFAVLAEKRAFPMTSDYVASLVRKGLDDPRSLSGPEVLQLCKTIAAHLKRLDQGRDQSGQTS